MLSSGETPNLLVQKHESSEIQTLAAMLHRQINFSMQRYYYLQMTTVGCLATLVNSHWYFAINAT